MDDDQYRHGLLEAGHFSAKVNPGGASGAGSTWVCRTLPFARRPPPEGHPAKSRTPGIAQAQGGGTIDKQPAPVPGRHSGSVRQSTSASKLAPYQSGKREGFAHPSPACFTGAGCPRESHANRAEPELGGGCGDGVAAAGRHAVTPAALSALPRISRSSAIPECA